MNTVKKVKINGEVGYMLYTETGEKFPCTRWFEKKTGQWHVKLPKDNPSGRTYIRESYFDKGDEVEFETKTEFRKGLSSGGWRSKLTPEEIDEVKHHELMIENIKRVAMTREIKKLDPNSIEGMMAMMAKLQAKLEKAQAKNITDDEEEPEVE